MPVLIALQRLYGKPFCLVTSLALLLCRVLTCWQHTRWVLSLLCTPSPDLSFDLFLQSKGLPATVLSVHTGGAEGCPAARCPLATAGRKPSSLSQQTGVSTLTWWVCSLCCYSDVLTSHCFTSRNGQPAQPCTSGYCAPWFRQSLWYLMSGTAAVPSGDGCFRSLWLSAICGSCLVRAKRPAVFRTEQKLQQHHLHCLVVPSSAA